MYITLFFLCLVRFCIQFLFKCASASMQNMSYNLCLNLQLVLCKCASIIDPGLGRILLLVYFIIVFSFMSQCPCSLFSCIAKCDFGQWATFIATCTTLLLTAAGTRAIHYLLLHSVLSSILVYLRELEFNFPRWLHPQTFLEGEGVSMLVKIVKPCAILWNVICVQ